MPGWFSSAPGHRNFFLGGAGFWHFSYNTAQLPIVEVNFQDVKKWGVFFFCLAATVLLWVWHCRGPSHLTPTQDAVVPFQASQTKKTTGYCFPRHVIRKNWPSFIQFPHLGTWNVSLFNQDFRFFRKKLNFSSGFWTFLDLYFYLLFVNVFPLPLKKNIVGVVICH